MIIKFGADEKVSNHFGFVVGLVTNGSIRANGIVSADVQNAHG
jgi:hypothetical protein